MANRKIPNRTQLKIYLQLRRIGASPRQADNFIKKHKIGRKK